MNIRLTEREIGLYVLQQALSHLTESDLDTNAAHRLICWAMALIETGKARRA